MTACSTEREARAQCLGYGSFAGPVEVRRRAGVCMRMMGKRVSPLLLVVPGLLLIVAGVLIVFEPGLLVWLFAAGFALLGLMLLTAAAFIRRVGAPPRD